VYIFEDFCRKAAKQDKQREAYDFGSLRLYYIITNVRKNQGGGRFFFIKILKK